MSKRNTLSDMDAKVKAGMKVAREAVTDPALLQLCDELERTWEHIATQLLIVAVGLSAMKYRSPDQIEAQLIACQQMFKQGVERATLFVPGNELEN